MTVMNELLNQPILKMGRAYSICWIMFGKSFIEKDFYGEEVKKGEFSLHLQGSWRIIDTKNSIIKVASGDMYVPNSETEWSEDFDWDIQGNNLLDEKTKDLFQEDSSVYVKNITISEIGDLTILFSNMFVLECFIDGSTDQECWRFFKHGAEKHLVYYGNGHEFA